MATLDEVAEDMKKVYGNDYNFTSIEIKPLLNRIVSAVNMGIKKLEEPFYWPHQDISLGETYLDLLRTMLQADTPPERAYARKSGSSTCCGLVRCELR